MRAAIAILVSLHAASPQDSFRATVNEVLVPVTITARNKPKSFLHGLTPADFALTDNGKSKPIRVDPMETANVPISLVVAVQVNDISEPALLKIRKTGAILQPLLAGETGRAAILGFGDRLELLHDFNASPDALASAIAALKPQRPITEDFQQFDPRRARLLDAVTKAANLLSRRPASHRRILLVISETRDRGSETTLADTLLTLQQSGVTVYHASFSATRTAFTTRAGDEPPLPGGPNYIGALGELVRKGKTNDAAALTTQTGGLRLTFATLNALEKSLIQFGEEIHSQYLLSFTGETFPAGFRTIQVTVRRPDVTIRARPGYWVPEIGTEKAR